MKSFFQNLLNRKESRPQNGTVVFLGEAETYQSLDGNWEERQSLRLKFAEHLNDRSDVYYWQPLLAFQVVCVYLETQRLETVQDLARHYFELAKKFEIPSVRYSCAASFSDFHYREKVYTLRDYIAKRAQYGAYNRIPGKNALIIDNETFELAGSPDGFSDSLELNDPDIEGQLFRYTCYESSP